MEKLTDQEVVAAILRRDRKVTNFFLYNKYFPLFNSIFNRYYTDCQSTEELINEIYLFILYPNESTGRCRLEDFGFKCSLPMWLKIVAENYCRHLFGKKLDFSEINYDIGDRLLSEDESLELEIKSVNTCDVSTLLNLMPNERYRKLIELRYLEEKTNEETAQLLEMNMANFYNKHKLAKAQFCEVLRKEGLI